jgi:hypothetical protein
MSAADIAVAFGWPAQGSGAVAPQRINPKAAYPD